MRFYFSVLFCWILASGSAFAQTEATAENDHRFLGVLYDCKNDSSVNQEQRCLDKMGGLSGIAYDSDNEWYFLSDGSQGRKVGYFKARITLGSDADVDVALSWLPLRTPRYTNLKEKSGSDGEAISKFGGNLWWINELDDTIVKEDVRSSDQIVYCSLLSGKRQRPWYGIESMAITTNGYIWYALERPAKEDKDRGRKQVTVLGHSTSELSSKSGSTCDPSALIADVQSIRQFTYPLGFYNADDHMRSRTFEDDSRNPITKVCSRKPPSLKEFAFLDDRKMLFLESKWDPDCKINTSQVFLVNIPVATEEIGGPEIVEKQLFIDLNKSLGQNGTNGFDCTSDDPCPSYMDNFEGMALGPVIKTTDHPSICPSASQRCRFLILTTDDNFRHSQQTLIVGFAIKVP